MDSWKLDDVPGLKQRVTDACRSVFQHRARASTTNKFICLLFMQSVEMPTVAQPMATEANEQSWRILLTALRDREMLAQYVAYVDGEMEAICADAADLRSSVGVTTYQCASESEVVVEHKDTKEQASYGIQGVADATSDDAVLEITSRDANYKTKVQQAHLYAGMQKKRKVYNYYIEKRLLVRRTRIESADDFMQRAAEELVAQRGLPGCRQKIDRASLLAEYSVCARDADSPSSS